MEFSKDEIEKLKNMPAIKNRRKYNNLKVMTDGTVTIGENCKVSKCQDGKGAVEIYAIEIDSREVQYAMDIISDFGETHIESTTYAYSSIIDENGFEKELSIKSGYGNNIEMWKFLKFDEIPSSNGRRIIRENGLIKEQEVEFLDTGKIKVKSERKYYDLGEPCLKAYYGADVGIESTKIGRILGELKENRDYINRENPELNGIIKQKEDNLLEMIRKRYLKVSFANMKLNREAVRSIEMQECICNFIQLIRDNFFGHLIFGKEAEELIGKRDRDEEKLLKLPAGHMEEKYYEALEEEPKTLEEMKQSQRVKEFNRYLDELNKMDFGVKERRKILSYITGKLEYADEGVNDKADFIIKTYKKVDKCLEFVKKVQRSRLTKNWFKKELLELEKQIRPKEESENKEQSSDEFKMNSRKEYLESIKSYKTTQEAEQKNKSIKREDDEGR